MLKNILLATGVVSSFSVECVMGAGAWDYKLQGDDWPTLADPDLACTGTERQSPIDVISADAQEAAERSLTLHVLKEPPSSLKVLNNGHTVQVESSDGSSLGELVYQGKTYSALQFHFHAPAEHLYDGVRYDLECHIVHRNVDDDGDYAVVGAVFAPFEAPSAFLADLLAVPPPSSEGSVTKTCDDLGPSCLHIDELLPTGMNYYNYNGSLTTPPCSEIVTWFAAKYPLPAQQEQIDSMKALFAFPDTLGNYRNAQAFPGTLYEVTSSIVEKDDNNGGDDSAADSLSTSTSWIAMLLTVISFAFI